MKEEDNGYPQNP